MRELKSYKFGKRHFLFLLLSLILLLPNFFSGHLAILPSRGHAWEAFDSQLATRLVTINDILKYTDSIASENGVSQDRLMYATYLNRVIKKRFYHGYSHYSLSQNWIAAISGAIFWDHLSSIVLPEDILKYPMAACSQQSIILMECFKRRGIDFRKVGFDHHFALEGKINGQWYFFDPDLEPDFSEVARTSFVSLSRDNKLNALYASRLDSAGIRWGLANQYYGTVNKAPAPRACVFHYTTKILSKVLWLFPLFGLVFPYSKSIKLVQSVGRRTRKILIEKAACL